jgi:hypothetical protein
MSRNYEMTDWAQVDAFCAAVAQFNHASVFSTSVRFPLDRAMDKLMPVFDQFWATEISVSRPPNEVFAALSSLEAREMKLADVLGRIRTLGRAERAPQGESFMDSAVKFGNVPLVNDGSREIAAGLIGQFWRLDFGIRRVPPQEFVGFNEAGYAKVVSNFRVDDDAAGGSRVYSEMRIHSTSPEAARKFAVYWSALGPGIHLFMRSALNAIKRRAESEKSGHPTQSGEAHIFR